LNIKLPRSTETHFLYVWGCQSFWNEAETVVKR
jgi:hypothetical protein